MSFYFKTLKRSTNMTWLILDLWKIDDLDVFLVLADSQREERREMFFFSLNFSDKLHVCEMLGKLYYIYVKFELDMCLGHMPKTSHLLWWVALCSFWCIIYFTGYRLVYSLSGLAYLDTGLIRNNFKWNHCDKMKL